MIGDSVWTIGLGERLEVVWERHLWEVWSKEVPGVDYTRIIATTRTIAQDKGQAEGF